MSIQGLSNCCKKLLKEVAEVYSNNNELNDASNFDDDKDYLSDTD